MGNLPKLVNLYLNPGEIKCIAMTSLLASAFTFKTETITIEAMGIKTDIDYQPPVTYQYYVHFQYSYGRDGILFWGWFFIMIVFMLLLWIFRMCRLIKEKELMNHPKDFLINIKKKVMDEGVPQEKKVFKKNFFGFAIKQDEKKAMRNGDDRGGKEKTS